MKLPLEPFYHGLKCFEVSQFKKKKEEEEAAFANVDSIVYFFSFIFIIWRLITLQYCSGFCIH